MIFRGTSVFFAIVCALPAQTSRVIRPDVSRFPDKPWVAHGGEWAVREGALHASGGKEAKLAVDGMRLGDFQLDVELRAAAGAQAGVVFRGNDLEEGNDGFHGYYAGIDASNGQLVWGANDPSWRRIASQPAGVEADTWYRLRLQVAGDGVKVFVNEKPLGTDAWPVFDGIDDAFERGSIAFRCTGGDASFRNLELRQYRAPRLTRSYTNPLADGPADPVVFFHKGIYHAYVTYTLRAPRREQGIRLYTSRDLVSWRDEGFALKARDSWGESGFWAPDIAEKDGTFYLYYAANERMCVATAKSPMGPFRQETKAPMEPASIRIDGHVFEDDDGKRYFYYVSFGAGNEIWGGRLNDDMTSVDESSLRLMVKPDRPWEQHRARVTEGPEMLKHKGTYYLTYSGSHYQSPEYSVGYATSDNPLGPWTKFRDNPVMKSTTYARGTAHHCFTKSPDGKELFIVYHRHHGPERANPRKLAIDRARFAPDPAGGPDILQVHGPTSSPQPMPSGAR